MKNLKIVENKNVDFMFKLLSLKLENEGLTKWKNEKYFTVVSEDNILYGISRIVTSFTEDEIELLKNTSYYKNFNFKEEEFENLIAFFGIWISPSIRNLKFGQKLINKRAELLNEKSIIISDVRVSSPLLNYYKKTYNMEEIKKTKTHCFLKKLIKN